MKDNEINKTLKEIEQNTEMALVQSEKIASSVDGLEPALEGILLNTKPKEVQKIKIEGAEIVTIKGDKGDKPTKGEDYFTPEEIQSIIDEIQGRIVLPRDGIDGYTPVKGQDYWTAQEIKDMLDFVVSKIPPPIPGKDAVVDYDRVLLDVLSQLPEPKKGDKGEKGERGSPDTGKEIKEKLEGLKEGEGLDYEKLSNKPHFEEFITRAVRAAHQSSKTVSLTELDDVDFSGLSIVNGKYVLGSGAGGGTLAATLLSGNTTGGTDIIVSAGDVIKSPSATGTSIILDDGYMTLSTDNGNYNTPFITLDPTKLSFASLGSSQIDMDATSIHLNHTSLIQFSIAAVRFNALTASRVPYLDASKNLVVSAVTPTELGYLSGVSSGIQSQINAKEPTITAGTTAQYWRGDKSWQTLDKSAVGLGNVDNTSDANKPVSTATQTALNAKQDTLVSATNIKTINGSSLLGSGDLVVAGYTNLTQFVAQTAWRLFYSNGSGDVTELALGADGEFLKSTGATSAPIWETPAGSGDVSKVGTPVDNQIGVWTGDGTIEGDANLTWNGTSFNIATGKNFQIAGATILTDVAGTTTLSNIDALDATTEATIEAAIDTLANLVSIQGRTVTLADAGADAFLIWDDSASAYQNSSQADARTILGLGSAALVATDLADLNEATIEAAIDTLANLTSIQGFTVTLADAGADALLGWDDSANAYENMTQAEVLAIIGASSATAQGVVELATDAEAVTGTDTARAVTPANLTARMAAPGAIGGTTPANITGLIIQANTSFVPDADGGAALGSATLGFSILGLASGSTINFANSNVVLTHSSGILTMGTGEMRITTPGTNSASVVTVGGTQTLTSKTLTTPVINGTITGTGQATAATASTITMRDTNANITANNWLGGYTTTATAAGTTTLTVASTYLQYFTGATTQTVTLPAVSTLVLGTQYVIVNNSTGAVTVNSSGGNAVVILAGGTSTVVTSIATSGTDATVWSQSYAGVSVTSAKKLSVSNTLTLAGTDGTTMTFPTTSATIARTDAANTFTGTQTFNGTVALGTQSITMTGSIGATGARVTKGWFTDAEFTNVPTLGGSVLVDDTAYASGWNGVTNRAPSMNAVYDKIESMGPWDVSIKLASDFVVTNNAALQDVTGMTFAATNGDIWYIELRGTTTANNTTGDIYGDIITTGTWSTTLSVIEYAVYYGITGTQVTVAAGTTIATQGGSTTGILGSAALNNGDAVIRLWVVRAMVVMTASGNIKVAIANNSAAAGRTSTLKAGTTLLARKLT